MSHLGAKKLISVTTLENYLSIYSASKTPFTCRICNKSFILKSQLNKHISDHPEHHEYFCGACTRVFDNRNDLLKHSQIHDKSMPHFSGSYTNLKLDDRHPQTNDNGFSNAYEDGKNIVFDDKRNIENDERSNIMYDDRTNIVCDDRMNIVCDDTTNESHEILLDIKPQLESSQNYVMENDRPIIEKMSCYVEQLLNCVTAPLQEISQKSPSCITTSTDNLTKFCPLFPVTQQSIISEEINSEKLKSFVTKNNSPMSIDKQFACEVTSHIEKLSSFISVATDDPTESRQLSTVTQQSPITEKTDSEKRTSLAAQDNNQKSNTPCNSDKPFACEVCQKTFITKRDLHRHLRYHSGEKPYACQFCDKSYVEITSLRRHFRVHTRERPFSCELCGKCFSQRPKLALHYRVHTDERPYKCELCDKSFKQKNHLIYHIRVHNKVKRYSCDVCENEYLDSGNLKKHRLRIHFLKGAYSCKECGKCFDVEESLQSHLRSHSDTKQYVCQDCKEFFSEKYTLQQHSCKHAAVKAEPSYHGCNPTFSSAETLVPT